MNGLTCLIRGFHNGEVVKHVQLPCKGVITPGTAMEARMLRKRGAMIFLGLLLAAVLALVAGSANFWHAQTEHPPRAQDGADGMPGAPAGKPGEPGKPGRRGARGQDGGHGGKGGTRDASGGGDGGDGGDAGE